MEIIEKDLPQLTVGLDSLDDSANYVHITDVKENTNYYCPCCKGLIKPRAYKKDINYQVQPHFCHETGGCSDETYIHYICKNWLFEKGCKFIINDTIYEVDSIQVEKILHTSFGDYRPDIIVTTTVGKVFYFEIKVSNKKTDLYAPKWDELGNDVVEVDTRYFINQKCKNDIPEFNLIYSDGECFIKSYSRTDYEETIARRKLEWKRQDKLNYKIQWERLDWFWISLRDYKENNNDDKVEETFKFLDFSDQFEVCEIVKKMNCQSLYPKLHDIAISNFKSEVLKLNSQIVTISIHKKKNCKNIILITIKINYSHIEISLDSRKILYTDYTRIKNEINAFKKRETKFIDSYKKLKETLAIGEYEINTEYGIDVYSYIRGFKKKVGSMGDLHGNGLSQRRIDYFFECVECDKNNYNQEIRFDKIRRLLISNKIIEKINSIALTINPRIAIDMNENLSIRCMFTYKDISCDLFVYETFRSTQEIELDDITSYILKKVVSQIREYNQIVTFDYGILDYLILIRDRINNCKNGLWQSSIALKQNNFENRYTKEKITTSEITLWIKLFKDNRDYIVENLIIHDNKMLFQNSDAYKNKKHYDWGDSEWRIFYNEDEVFQNVENIMISLIFQYRNKFKELLIVQK